MLMRLFAKISGLSKIAGLYSTSRVPRGERLMKQTVQIGAVRYRRCVFIVIDPEGFFFYIRTVIGECPRILIPWDEFSNIEAAEIYRKRA